MPEIPARSATIERRLAFLAPTIAGTRVVLRKGRNRHCWHWADARETATVLRGLSVRVVA